MEEFKTHLKAYVSNELSITELEDELYACLRRDSSNARPIQQALKNLSERQVIGEDVYTRLINVLQGYQDGEPPPSSDSKNASFQDLIKAYVSNQVAYEDLENGLVRELNEHPDKVQRYSAALDVLAKQDVVPAEAITKLKAKVDEFLDNEAGDEGTRFKQRPDPKDGEGGEDKGGEDKGGEEDGEKTRLFGRRRRKESSRGRREGTSTRAQGGRTSTQGGRTSTGGGTSSLWKKPFKEEDDVPLQVGSVLAGRFRLTEFIGYGGMGDVYKAEDLLRVEANDADAEVAVKVLNKEFKRHPESLTALQREARKTQSLAHPHIVNVYDFSRDEHQVFMTMEVMRGKDLSDLIKMNPDGFPLDVAKRYIGEMSDALGYAHRRGVIHSDFKPGNIFIDNDEVKILDFGIAREAGQTPKDSFDAGELGALTPSYASPEMLEDGTNPDPRDDIYALGCIAYELITGKHPFRQGKRKMPADKAREAGMKPERIPELKPWQWNALARCLEFDRDKRTGKLSDFTDEFLLERRPVNTKLILGSAAAVVALIAFGLYLPTYLTEREVENFRALVENGEQHQEIMTHIDDIQTRDPDEEQLFFENEMREVVLDYLATRVQELIETDEFVKAEPYLAQARELYSYHGRFLQLDEEFTARRNERINDLDTELNDLLNSDEFESRYAELGPLWETFRKIDKNYPQEASARLAIITLSDASRELMSEEKFGEADQMMEFGLELLGDDQRIASEYSNMLALKNSLENRLDRYQKEERVAQLAGNIDHISSSSSLEEMQAVVDDVNRLYQLEPNNATLLAYQDALERKLENEVQAQIATQNWEQPVALVDRFEPALKPSTFTELKETVTTAQSQFEERVSNLTRNIKRVSRGSNPGEALPLLAELRTLNVEPDVISEAENEIAGGWLKQSRLRTSQGEWDDAREHVASALEVTSDLSLRSELREQIGRIERAEQGATTELATEEAERLEREREQRIAQLETDVQDAVENKALSGDGADEIVDLLDRLEIEDPNNEVLASARETLLQRYLTESRQLADAGELDQAMETVRAGLDVFPSESRLADTKDSLEARQQERLQAQREQQIARLETRLESLIANFGSTLETEKLMVALAEYEALQNGETTFSKDIRFQAADAWINEAERLKEQNRFDDAIDAIDNAQQIDSSHGRIAGLRDDVVDSRQAYQNEQAEARRLARIAGLKQSYINQMQARDISSARSTLTTLREENLDENDEFFTKTVPNEAEVAFLALAEQVDVPENLDDAIDYVEEGLEYKPDSGELQQKLSLYQKAERIMATAQVNASQARQLLEQARADHPNVALFTRMEMPAAEEAEPQVAGRPCSANMKGMGYRSAATCYDAIGEIKGPRLVVVESTNGPLAMMRYELRVGDYNAYCESTGNCTPSGKEENLPMTGLSVSEVKAYAGWLSSETGKEYRIPTYEEWRVAASADGNLQRDRNCVSVGGSRGQRMEDINAWKQNGLNGWGLAHSVGNAQELVIDGSSYKAAGGAYVDPNQECTPELAKATDESGDPLTGVRLVRTL
ncbi:MAG: protein kinase [Pseudomonadales bacterium]